MTVRGETTVANFRLGEIAPRTIFAAALALAVGACDATRVQLYDKSKAAAASAINEKYKNAEVLGVIKTQRANLDALKSEESKVVDDNLRLQRDYALLAMVDGDAPMAKTWREDVEKPIAALGFENSGALRNYLIGQDLTDLRDEQMQRLVRFLKEKAGIDPPACMTGKTLPESLDFLPKVTIAPNALNRAKARYEIYKQTCTKLKAAQAQTQVVGAGRLRTAEAEWISAKDALAERTTELEKARKEIKGFTKQHTEAVAEVKEASTKGDALREAVKEKAGRLSKALQEASKRAPEAVAEERISAIVTLLNAAASENTDVNGDENLASAVAVASGLPSLSGDMAELVAEAKAPSINNLLIELQHQTILVERAKAMQTLQQRRVEILETKYDAFREEADLLLAFRDGLCSVAFLSSGGANPDAKTCDQLTIPEKETTCRVGGNNIANCGLSKRWNQLLARPPDGQAGREFYKTIAAYMQLFPVRAAQVKQNFELVDLKHRENLAAREMALRSWNNLAAVPIEQLDAYYQSGIKAEAIADIIVKALGFTAIAVGVSQ